jgi:diaminohydroxyphosphoribosylaminopyrimidine deaminase/5-amino-6-(5-phosphoribosylamino)uracil reductase
METEHIRWMQRCLELAIMGSSYARPNPMVGAVLVHEGRIIGEGYHRRYGEAHAEVRCLASVPEALKGRIPSSTMYVSLEPCAHHGKTPPCADRIVAEKIPRVVVGCRDSFAEVSGRGITRLREAGVEVITGVEEAACRELNRRFFTFHEQKRPYIVLKWARSPDGFVALPGYKSVRISSPVTDRLVHRWRSEEAAILVGSRTAEYDDPALTNRLWSGQDPLRIVLDRSGRLPEHLRVFQGPAPTWVFTRELRRRQGNAEWLSVFPPQRFLEEVMGILHERKILSVLVEGGAAVLGAFIAAGLWDEARVITGRHYLREGLAAPALPGAVPVAEEQIGPDRITYYRNIA